MLEIKKIESLLKAKDSDSIYFGVDFIRKNPIIFGSKGKKLLNSVSIKDKIKNYSDVCEELQIKELAEDDFSFLPKNQRKRLLASHKIENITKVFNGDVLLDFSNSSQKKFIPWFCRTGSGWSLYSVACSLVISSGSVGFYYKSEELAQYAVKIFINIYLDLLD